MSILVPAVYVGIERCNKAGCACYCHNEEGAEEKGGSSSVQVGPDGERSSENVWNWRVPVDGW